MFQAEVISLECVLRCRSAQYYYYPATPRPLQSELGESLLHKLKFGIILISKNPSQKFLRKFSLYSLLRCFPSRRFRTWNNPDDGRTTMVLCEIDCVGNEGSYSKWICVKTSQVSWQYPFLDKCRAMKADMNTRGS